MDEEDLLPLSAIAQYGYCPRRAGLMLLEQSWADNIHTAEGTLEHERTHEAGADNRRDAAELRSVAVRSLLLGVSGSIDRVELHSDPKGYDLKNRAGRWTLRPVEYKHGAVRSEKEYELQLCAQAIALEEMLHCRIEEGDLFYYDDHRRVTVSFTPQLRSQTLETAQKLHGMVAGGRLPEAVKSRKCRECSLREICLPQIGDHTSRHLAAVRETATQGDPQP
jgi:CRISPR-associated exonuclease Cas4